jgi:hypothetical protein
MWEWKMCHTGAKKRIAQAVVRERTKLTYAEEGCFLRKECVKVRKEKE